MLESKTRVLIKIINKPAIAANNICNENNAAADFIIFLLEIVLYINQTNNAIRKILNINSPNEASKKLLAKRLGPKIDNWNKALGICKYNVTVFNASEIANSAKIAMPIDFLLANCNKYNIIAAIVNRKANSSQTISK